MRKLTVEAILPTETLGVEILAWVPRLLARTSHELDVNKPLTKYVTNRAVGKEGVKWMALARVHTSNEFTPPTFYSRMPTAWDNDQEIKFRALAANLFTIQCFMLGTLGD